MERHIQLASRGSSEVTLEAATAATEIRHDSMNEEMLCLEFDSTCFPIFCSALCFFLMPVSNKR